MCYTCIDIYIYYYYNIKLLRINLLMIIQPFIPTKELKAKLLQRSSTTILFYYPPSTSSISLSVYYVCTLLRKSNV